jgi:hypothetical protein
MPEGKDAFRARVVLAMRIAVVGNGRVGLAAAGTIDSYDLVVRLNYAKSLGFAGRRADILVLAKARMAFLSRGRFSAAYRAAKEVWCFLPEDMAQLRNEPIVPACPDWLLPALEGLRPGGGFKPSTGMFAVAVLVTKFPDAVVHVFGFSHEGMPAHDWAAERRLFDELAAQGRLVRHDPAEPVSWKEAALLGLHRNRRFLWRVLRSRRGIARASD